jgi:hypothetical protein
MKSRITLASVGLLAAAVMLGMGCQKLTYERWTTIHDGLPQLGVEKTLGEPQVKMSDQWTWNDTDRDIVAHVWFDTEGKVIAKQWFDPKRTMIGSPPGGDAVEGGKVIKQKTTIMKVE